MSDEYLEFFSHLTDNARISLYHANIIAQGYGSSYIGTEHLLLGILAQSSSVGAKILSDVGITFEKAQSALNLAPVTVVLNTEAKGLSETAKLTLKISWDIAKEHQQNLLGTEHILSSILDQKNSRAAVLLRDLNVDLLELATIVSDYLNNQTSGAQSVRQGVSSKQNSQRGKLKGALGMFGVDLTDMARDGKLDPVIGRKDQEDRAITILSRRTKNNPVFIGEPGVGKTAIVEGLAQRIINEEVPDHLIDKKIVQLDLAGMIAGTKYRGEFEDRFKKVINELTDQKNIIIFIDEIHLLVGAGAAEGTIDAANMLKPALARGELRLIGATTTEEYRKHIEKDSALERRLQSVVVPEPSLKDTVNILKGLKGRYEKHHGVLIEDQVIESIVYMANRYISERFMPDKAIDVVDEAAAIVRVKNSLKPSRSRDILKRIKGLNEKMEEAVSNEDYEKAAFYKTQTSKLSTELDKLGAGSSKKSKVKLTEDDVAQAVSSIAGVPVKRIQKSEATMLSNLEKHLAKYVIGQEEALAKVSGAIRRGRSGVSSDTRPIGSFVFMGPTGVGKTELARVLAREVFGSEKALIKIDMSEFGEKHNVSRLLGAPAGYIGYDDGAQLTDRIKRQPYSVVLFDEIEKAHSSVFNILLQILEDGYLTDAKGKKVNFSNSIVILTSNLGSDLMMKESSLGFHASTSSDEKQLEELHAENAEKALAALNRLMRPELINRFDNIITFRALTTKHINKIIDKLFNELKSRLARKRITLILKPSAKKILINKGYSEKYGARPLRRVIQDEIEHRLASGILSGKFIKGSVLEIGAKKGEIQINVKSE